MKFRKLLFPLLILIIVLIFFATNYKQGSFLTGWDNLQTELYPWLAVKRAFFSVWQEYQSFGLVAGMAHAADLPRALFIWIISLLLPQNLVRYFFIFFMLFLGGFGAIKLLSYVFINDKNNNIDNIAKNNVLAFFGAVFYIINLGTIQIFHVPYEAFIIFFGLLPWELWIFLKLIHHRSITKCNLLLFTFINFVASSQAYVQTLFFVYILMIILILLGVYLQSKAINILRNGLLLLILIISVNAYWIMPQIYFLKTSGNVVREAKINEFSDESYYQNKEKGDILSFLKLEGYYYDLSGTNQKPLFVVWKNHFNHPIIGILPYIFGIVILMGIFRKSKYQKAFILVYIIILIALLNNTLPFSLLNDWLRKNNLINQIFRSPFTKFIIPYALIASYFFSSGLDLIYIKINKYLLNKSRSLMIVLIGILSIFLLAYSTPAFQGNFISESMKVKIPQDYFEAINYFNNVDKNQRIALLPDYTFWGWFKHTWGYDGSGFLWYGIEQPIISRTFDVWSYKSENYFWEISRAINNENPQLLLDVLNKYNVNYFILDKSLFPVAASVKGMQVDRIEKIINQIQEVSLAYKTKYLSIYAIKSKDVVNSFVSLTDQLPNIGPSYKVTNYDPAYFMYKNYKTDNNQLFSSYFPYIDLISQTRIMNPLWKIEETNNNLFINTQIDSIYQLKNNVNFNYVTELYIDNNIQKNIVSVNNRITSNNLITEVSTKPIVSIDLNLSKINNCGSVGEKNETNIFGNKLIIKSYNGAIGCFGYSVPFLENKYGYLVKIANKNIADRRLYFYIQDETKKNSYLETRLQKDLEYFIINPQYKYGRGYYFAFQNNSYKHSSSINELSEISIYPFPEEELHSLELIDPNYINHSSVKTYFISAHKNNYFKYIVDGNNDFIDKNIVLYQTFQPGWKAYQIPKKNFIYQQLPFVFGTTVNGHFLVNNWANGWQLSPEQVAECENQKCQIVIVFWPQYLEYAGFILIALLFVGILAWPKKSNANNLLQS